MSEWYEQPYQGGPMVPLPGFPRPLYPPDAAKKGKQPSMNGPDVEAYKRVVWRLGRWAGPASEFDRAFSNGFSHGKGGDVIETGLAGVQRQGNVDDTGWIGEKTFNLLRSVRIPEDLNGPGEPDDMAMDAYAQSLLVEAWEMFKGEEPPPEPEFTLREAALQRALTQLGIKESPPNSNNTKYCDWYNMVGPWCAMFVTWCYEMEGDSPGFARGSRYAYVPYIVNDARNNKYGLSVTKDPVPGDVVCFDWHGDGCHDHVGIFERWTNRDQAMFTAIEGNTSTSNNSDGGEVMRRDRDLRSASIVFVKVKEP